MAESEPREVLKSLVCRILSHCIMSASWGPICICISARESIHCSCSSDAFLSSFQVYTHNCTWGHVKSCVFTSCYIFSSLLVAFRKHICSNEECSVQQVSLQVFSHPLTARTLVLRSFTGEVKHSLTVFTPAETEIHTFLSECWVLIDWLFWGFFL